MSKKQQIIYYDDEQNDEFSKAKIKAKRIDGNYKYVRDGFFARIYSFFMYRIIFMPISYLYLKIKKRLFYLCKPHRRRRRSIRSHNGSISEKRIRCGACRQCFYACARQNNAVHRCAAAARRRKGDEKFSCCNRKALQAKCCNFHLHRGSYLACVHVSKKL